MKVFFAAATALLVVFHASAQTASDGIAQYRALLADWVADGMRLSRDAVVARMRRLVERSILNHR